jgi:hypothetical protein
LLKGLVQNYWYFKKHTICKLNMYSVTFQLCFWPVRCTTQMHTLRFWQLLIYSSFPRTQLIVCNFLLMWHRYVQLGIIKRIGFHSPFIWNVLNEYDFESTPATWVYIGHLGLLCKNDSAPTTFCLHVSPLEIQTPEEGNLLVKVGHSPILWK